MKNAEEFIKDVNQVKLKYQDKIEVLCGFEVEAIKAEYEFHKQLIERDDVDYLILGNHFHSITNGDLIAYQEGNKDDGS
jgi:histidinol phosphatase-like PHP family hydrolase